MLWLRRRSGWWTFLVEILSSCCGCGGCHWHFLAPCNLRHSPCGFLYNHLCLSANDTYTSSVHSCCDDWWLWWRDTLKVQTATSRRHFIHESRESSHFSLCNSLTVNCSSCFPQISRIFSQLVICKLFSRISFSLLTYHHLFSLVLTIFVATSFSF